MANSLGSMIGAGVFSAFGPAARKRRFVRLQPA